MNNKVKGILVVVAIVVGLGMCHWTETHYTRKDCEIVKVDNSIITIEDKMGYLWEYETDTNTYTVGDKVSLRMHTNNTASTIYDDEIVEVVAH